MEQGPVGGSAGAVDEDEDADGVVLPVRWIDYDGKGRVVASYQLDSLEGSRTRFKKTLTLHMNYGGFWFQGAKSVVVFPDGSEEEVSAYLARVRRETTIEP